MTQFQKQWAQKPQDASTVKVIGKSQQACAQSTCSDTYDFSKSSKPCKWKTIGESVPSKIFRVKRKEGNQEVKVLQFHKQSCDSILGKLSERFRMNKAQIILEYAIARTDGKEEIISVSAADGAEGLEIFHCQASNMSLITIHETKKTPKRKMRPCEIKSKTIT